MKTKHDDTPNKKTSSKDLKGKRQRNQRRGNGNHHDDKPMLIYLDWKNKQFIGVELTWIFTTKEEIKEKVLTKKGTHCFLINTDQRQLVLKYQNFLLKIRNGTLEKNLYKGVYKIENGQLLIKSKYTYWYAWSDDLIDKIMKEGPMQNSMYYAPLKDFANKEEQFPKELPIYHKLIQQKLASSSDSISNFKTVAIPTQARCPTQKQAVILNTLPTEQPTKPQSLPAIHPIALPTRQPAKPQFLFQEPKEYDTQDLPKEFSINFNPDDSSSDSSSERLSRKSSDLSSEDSPQVNLPLASDLSPLNEFPEIDSLLLPFPTVEKPKDNEVLPTDLKNNPNLTRIPLPPSSLRIPTKQNPNIFFSNQPPIDYTRIPRRPLRVNTTPPTLNK